jgi:hypothetical protein
VIRHALVLGVAALAAAAGGASGAPAPARVLVLPGPVKELAADGGRVAILLQTTGTTCVRDRVAVWGPVPRTLVPIGAAPCARSTSDGAGLFGVALAGTRVAYVQFAGGTSRALRLRLASLSRPRPATVVSAAFGLETEVGTYVGRVAGDGSLLAFDWWSLCRPCAQVNPAASRSAVWRIVPSGSACPSSSGLGASRRCALVQAAVGNLRLLAAGSGLVAMLAGENTVTLRSARGESLAAATPNGQVLAARLDGSLVVALVRRGSANVLVRIDTKGAIADVARLPGAKSSGDAVCGDPSGCRLLPALRLEDFQSGIAVYVIGRDVHLLRLSDKRDVKVRAPGGGPVHAQLESSGLFYSYRPAASPGRGRVAFMPFPAVLALFR